MSDYMHCTIGTAPAVHAAAADGIHYRTLCGQTAGLMPVPGSAYYDCDHCKRAHHSNGAR